MSKQTENELAAVLRLIPRLYFKISARASELLKEKSVSPGQRSLMEDVALGGPQTIAALAQARPVAKQYVQKLVADLVHLGLVELLPNPQDGRSKLVQLTQRGAVSLKEWRDQESVLLAPFLSAVNAEDVHATHRFLSRLHEALVEELARTR